MFDKIRKIAMIAMTACFSMIALGLLNQQINGAQTFPPASAGLVSWWSSYSATHVNTASPVTNTFTVTNTNNSGAGSLREAIVLANIQAGLDTINFNIPASDPGCDGTTHVCKITPSAPLQSITSPVTIDGYTQPGAIVNTLATGDNAVLLIEISGATLGGSGSALVLVDGAGGSTIRGLVIDQGWNAAILVQTDTVSVEGCFIGTNPAGATASGNNQGVTADFGFATSGMRVGGTTPAARNVISGNSTGIFIRSGTNQLVQGNFIGTDATGTTALANTTAIDLRSSDNLIGGTTAAARNIIAGDGNTTGITISTEAVTPTGNRIQGNYIGTEVNGTTPHGFSAGVLLGQSSGTQIGGLTATPGTPPGNVIAGSSTGIAVQNGVSNNTIQGNLIGTDATGTAALGNLVDGIKINGPSNTVGGPTATARNVVSANGRHGISIGNNNASVHDNLVQGNFIGTDVTGSNALGNGGSGVVVSDAFANPISGNAIAFNANLGIDLRNDGVTLNDDCDGDNGNANNLQNFPVITDVHSASGNTTVTGTLNSAANTTFRIEFFANSSCDSSGKGEGQSFIGFTTVTTDASCNANFSIPITPEVPGGRFITTTATDPAGNTSEFSNCRFVISPTAANGVVTGRIVDQSGHAVEGAVVRLSGTQNRKFITDANGVYRFENVETTGFYTVTPSRVNYTFSPARRSFSQLGETTEAAFGATLSTSAFVNPLDTPEYFVRQHYIDFLGREPDEAGFNFWSDQILGCGGDQECISLKRENVSAAYFLSIEFQQTGGLVDGLYRVSYGRRPSFSEFMPDTASIAQNVMVGRGDWQQQLALNKAAFIEAFAQRAAFRGVYDNLTDDVYVDTLIANTGVNYSRNERDALVNGLTGGTLTRAAVLGQVAENERFISAKFNQAFVMMEYFGYLRRDPDESGYQFWLAKLNQFNGNFEQAEMVKAFIVSTEYRQRFGP